MPKPRELDVDELARAIEGVAHPFRVTILEILREKKRLPMGELRRLVEERYMPIETRNLQFHVFKMQMSGLVRMEREGNRDRVTLLRDVVVRVKDVGA